MRGLGKMCWIAPCLRYPAVPPHPTRVEGEDSRGHVEKEDKNA